MERTILLPHLDSTALQTLVIQLSAADNGNLPSCCGRAIHAQVLEWFRSGDPEVSEAIHKSQQSPLSLSDLVGEQRWKTVQEGHEFHFRIGLLNGDLLKPLLKGLEQWGDKPISLAQFPFVIRSIDMMPGTNPGIDSSTYPLIAQSAPTSRTLTLKFLSPTSFKLNSGQHIQPIPLPEAVFGSLHRRWNTFAPKDLRFPKIQWDGLICDYELKTQKLRMENSAELGFVGWVKYQFPDPEQSRVATVLSHFSLFAGVGRKTAMGMGQTVFER
ncbi:CRISPR system precrRNA processing endoribonuclease RAMP protein Cas6 [Kovacikia minuta CCNUW1]|uniref:CRISPR system precrRNA processing endoribonuclease RAMP protein Cas6 n=1 Tax=Kovacikia minuta TaxID=2931930 RepID=UPI001CCEFF11|nr:CRISPR system precrRNA processing endoribonuclease RAMP protein Cas6 [Kovacikia minuta]UBF28549.1 CRISPR system precrRNA processing endoribonuclease RAMP protein Cas6 [Kovacikia minuta CCNUW1]